MSRNVGTDASSVGINVERALNEHLPAELQDAERAVKALEAKLDAARERVYRLRAIAQAAGLTKLTDPSTPAPEPTA